MEPIDIPGHGPLPLRHLVLDYNGTLALDGNLVPGVAERLTELAAAPGALRVHVITADTFGQVRQQLAGLPCACQVIGPGHQDQAKLEYVRALGAPTVAAVGNGRNDRLMLDAADWQQFGRFVQLAAALTAQEVNFSQLGREIGITPQTSKRWLAVLAATFQWFELPAYQGNAIKRISSKPKGYLSDTGLACHLSRITSPDALGGHPMAGALFETAVVSEIRKLQSAMPRKAALYHWRTHGGSEVDLVLERDGLLYPIGIKLASRPTRNDARGFTALRASNPRQRIAPGLVLAPAEHIERLTDNDFVAPYDMV